MANKQIHSQTTLPRGTAKQKRNLYTKRPIITKPTWWCMMSHRYASPPPLDKWAVCAGNGPTKATLNHSSNDPEALAILSAFGPSLIELNHPTDRIRRNSRSPSREQTLSYHDPHSSSSSSSSIQRPCGKPFLPPFFAPQTHPSAFFPFNAVAFVCCYLPPKRFYRKSLGASSFLRPLPPRCRIPHHTTQRVSKTLAKLYVNCHKGLRARETKA